MALKKPKMQIWTPPGRISFPFFVAPDTGRQYSDDKYKTDLLIEKATFKEKGSALQAAVLDIGKQHFGDKFTIKNSKWKIPFKDTDTDEKIVNDVMKNCILIRAKTTKQPVFMGPRKGADGRFIPLTEKQIAELKGGDWCCLNVTVFPYDQSGGGIALALNAVQFWKTGEGFGQGKSTVIESAVELEAELDAAPVVVAGDDDDSIV